MSSITLVNEGVMKCRFVGIHNKVTRGDVKDAIAFTKETLRILDNAVENELSVELTEYYAGVLERTIMELRHNMRDCTAERLWTLAYTNKLYL